MNSPFLVEHNHGPNLSIYYCSLNLGITVLVLKSHLSRSRTVVVVGGGGGVNVHFCPLHIQNLKVDKIKSGQKWTKVDKIQITNYTTFHFHVKH